MKALVTGGAGFIGCHLARHLADQDYDVTILDNFARAEEDEDFKKLVDRENVTFLKRDITLAESFTDLEGFDYVYHLAAINGTGNFYKIPDKVLKVGVLGTLNVLDWFVTQPKGKLLFTSSSETYAGALRLLGEKFPIPTPEEVPFAVDDPTNVRWSYGASKIIGEVAMHAYAKAHDMKNYVIIRYHNIYGPRMGFEHVIPQFIERVVKKENPFKIYGGQETRTFCYVDDGVRATQLVMESGTNGQTIHIGRSDDELKILDLAQKVFNVAGVSPEIDVQPAPEGSVMRRCPDIAKLEKLGFAPSTSLNEGIKQCYDWYEGKFT
ncbi:MAG: NAD-dependent epimerase/dehydratase family protein [Candidatus Woesearchaeota archaeon]|nr:NAD-dependent epimerase/dehydratase family protein [Candidatus Woesearchaeota archaeon]